MEEEGGRRVGVWAEVLHYVGSIKGALSGLREFLATESPLKMMKNSFYFTLKALFVLQIPKFLSRLFGYVAKRLDKKFEISN